ncbi:3-phosphoshikimate 1-carboxyvinyltransferase [Candidatus Fermentibacteria bacterium]|nr:3-phosphoshikimate 1-carboxyvinyltransferase [Candidatus Fermentibacteria bacterium]
MTLKGEFSPPGDKSVSHRVVLMSLLADGKVEVENLSRCTDVKSSMAAAAELGAKISQNGDLYLIEGTGDELSRSAYLDCGNSGTTIRLLCGILAGAPGRFVLDGDDSLRRRPMERVAEPLRAMGAVIRCRYGKCPVEVSGATLRGTSLELSVPSAQVKSAVLLAACRGFGPTSIVQTVETRDHTERLLELMGSRVLKSGQTMMVGPSRLRLPARVRVPGDPSSAAFFLCGAAMVPGSEITARGVMLNPTRNGFLEVMRRMGADLKVARDDSGHEPEGSVTVRYTPRLKGCRVRSEEIPGMVDEIPILALLASTARGETVFQGVGELRVKESDRLSMIQRQLGRLNAGVSVEGDDLVVRGPSRLRYGRTLDSGGDHRIAMTLRMASLLTKGQPEIQGEDSVNVSYPGFHRHLEMLRGRSTSREMAGQGACIG